MFSGMIEGVLAQAPNPAQVVLVFFAYSLIGYIMECVVLTIEHRSLVLDRGFASHLPLCVIYGFGCLFGYILMRPFADNLPLLFLMGAVMFTAFEFAVGQVQIRLFGDYWWDYSHKRLNYKGIICLQSTIGWGIGAVVLVRGLHGFVDNTVGYVPAKWEGPVAIALVALYLADFLYSAWVARRQYNAEDEAGPETYERAEIG